MELFLFVLGAAALFKIIRAWSRRGHNQGYRGMEPAPRKDSQTERPGPGPLAQWFGATETPVVNGNGIPGGLVYVGEKLPDFSGFNDPCLINLELRVAPGTILAEPSSAGPLNYGTMTAEDRGAYLSWLAGGRMDPEAPIAYVFLFFYGLERRIIVDGRRGNLSAEERAEVIAEVRKLLKIYSQSEDFCGHSMNLLAMEWAIYGNREEPPSYIDFAEPLCGEALKAVLARHAARDEPIPSERVLQWLALNPDLWKKSSADGFGDAFRELFTRRYEEKYGAGMVIHPSRSPLVVTYQGASPSLKEGLKIPIPELPDPFVISVPAVRLTTLADLAVDELEAGANPSPGTEVATKREGTPGGSTKLN